MFVVMMQIREGRPLCRPCIYLLFCARGGARPLRIHCSDV